MCVSELVTRHYVRFRKHFEKPCRFRNYIYVAEVTFQHLYMCFRNRASDTALLKLHAVTCQKNYCNRCVLSCRHLLAWVSGWGVGANMVTFVIATVVSNFV